MVEDYFSEGKQEELLTRCLMVQFGYFFLQFYQPRQAIKKMFLINLSWMSPVSLRTVTKRFSS